MPFTATLGVMVDKSGMISCINGPDTQHQSLLSWTSIDEGCRYKTKQTPTVEGLLLDGGFGIVGSDSLQKRRTDSVSILSRAVIGGAISI